MQTIMVHKEKLLEVLRKNREGHRKIFEEALDGYRKEVVKRLDEQLARAKAGKRVYLAFQIVEPQNQTKDYDRAIGMLEMSIDDEISLSESDFRNYVMDDWNWKHQFLSSNAMYSGSAASSLDSMETE